MTGRFREIVLITAALLSLGLGVLEMADNRFNPVSGPADAAARDIMVPATVVYVSLRTVNGVLSVAESSQVGASAIGQVILQPLKLLEPVDDTVERISGVVFAVAVGAALINVGIEVVTGLGLCLLGIGLLGLAAQDRFGPNLAGFGLTSIPSLSWRAVRIGAALGVILPISFAVGANLSAWATAVPTAEALAVFERVQSEAAGLVEEDRGVIDADADAVSEESRGWLDRIGDGFASVGGNVGGVLASTGRYLKAIPYFLGEADAIFEAGLTMIGMFILRILILPALLLYGLMRLLPQLVHADLDKHIQTRLDKLDKEVAKISSSQVSKDASERSSEQQIDPDKLVPAGPEQKVAKLPSGHGEDGLDKRNEQQDTRQGS